MFLRLSFTNFAVGVATMAMATAVQAEDAKIKPESEVACTTTRIADGFRQSRLIYRCTDKSDNECAMTFRQHSQRFLDSCNFDPYDFPELGQALRPDGPTRRSLQNEVDGLEISI